MPRDRSAGFTLVETLASLSILALLSLLIVSGAQFARLRLMRMDQGSNLESVQMAQDMLRARLVRSFPLAHPFAATSWVALDGAPDRLNFVAPPADAAAPDAVRHYTVWLSPNGDLTLSWVSDLALDPDHQAEKVVLLRHVSSIDLAYFGAARPDGALRWRERWSRQPVLPLLVRLRVTFPPGDPRLWPELLANPAATVDSSCTIDPNTGRCRGRS